MERESRSGAGVGYRTSDGTMHIGKWENNSPTNYGARFNKDGTFIDVADYANGVKNGKMHFFRRERQFLYFNMGKRKENFRTYY